MSPKWFAFLHSTRHHRHQTRPTRIPSSTIVSTSLLVRLKCLSWPQDLKKILIDDFQRPQKDFGKKRYEDRLKKIIPDLLKIFSKKDFNTKSFLKIFKRSAEEHQRKSYEKWDLMKIFIKYLNEISFSDLKKRFGSWVTMLDYFTKLQNWRFFYQKG